MVVIGDGALLYCTVAHVNDNKTCHSTETEMTALQAEMTGIKDSMAEAREKLMAQVKYASICSRMLTHADVCSRMLTYRNTWRRL
jgi:antirestriction protein ArdC